MQWEVADWIHVLQNRVWWWAAVNRVRNIELCNYLESNIYHKHDFLLVGVHLQYGDSSLYIVY